MRDSLRPGPGGAGFFPDGESRGTVKPARGVAGPGAGARTLPSSALQALPNNDLIHATVLFPKKFLFPKNSEDCHSPFEAMGQIFENPTRLSHRSACNPSKRSRPGSGRGAGLYLKE